ncbi:MAG: hypothetical protein H6813_01670 [Phycisphaeraceae bacterium]|nr:hypothetical protein [Phycisphaeraceae bacterium]
MSIRSRLWLAVPVALGVLAAVPGLQAQPSTIQVRPADANAPKLLREGAFLSGMKGELRRTELGWVMDFAPDAVTGERLASMLLQHGMTLTAMEQIIDAHEGPIGFIVSGQVFVFHERNYLLPTKFEITAPSGNPAMMAENPQDEAAGAAPDFIPGLDDGGQEPSVEGLLGGFEEGGEANADAPLSPAGSGVVAGLREGMMIADIRGRILPGAGGDLEFTQDNDADEGANGAALPPMRLMPCLNVERFEALRLEWGDRLVVRISGRVFMDEGRPALLPTMYIVELERTGNLSLGQ